MFFLFFRELDVRAVGSQTHGSKQIYYLEP